jgi:Uma2 family endonuclease
MAEVGIFAPERVELIEGQLYDVCPIGSEHASAADQLFRLLVSSVGDRGVVLAQKHVWFTDLTEVSPDLAVLTPRNHDYKSAALYRDDVLLLVEVADKSLDYDRGLKRMLYAQHGIEEYWIVNLVASMVEIYRKPVGDNYTSGRCFGIEVVMEIEKLPGVVIPLTPVFGRRS